jgi:putative membrane protein
VTDHTASHDGAMDGLRTAYARGDLSDEEFETRREKLDNN